MAYCFDESKQNIWNRGKNMTNQPANTKNNAEVVDELIEIEVEAAAMIVEDLKNKNQLKKFKDSTDLIENKTSHIFLLKSRQNGKKFCGTIDFKTTFKSDITGEICIKGFCWDIWIDRNVPWKRDSVLWMCAHTWDEVLRKLNIKYEVLMIEII